MSSVRQSSSGCTSNVENPLKQGFVTLGSDGGHKASGPGFDGRWALDDEALANFGKLSVKKAHDAAMAVIKKAYGRAPERFFFIGGSQGGHEALDAAARYPADYDGVVAHYPARQADRILTACRDRASLEAQPVHEFVALFVRN